MLLALKIVKESLAKNNPTVKYVEVDAEKKTLKFLRLPERNELPQDIQESQIVEYYNRLL